MIGNRQRELAYRELERVEDEQALHLGTADSDGARPQSAVTRDRPPRAIFSEPERPTRWSAS
jgi:hypothetical protein